MKKRILLIAFTMIFALTLVTACGAPDSDVESGSEKDNVPPETEKKTIGFILPEGSEYTVVSPFLKNTIAVENIVGKGCGEVYKSVFAKFGYTLTMTDDFTKEGNDPNTNPMEILVGKTNRRESIEAYNMIKEGEGIIAVINGKLVVQGRSEELTLATTRILLSEYITDEGLILEEDYMAKYTFDKTFEARTFKNPVCDSGADPWIVRDEHELYYCYSGGDGVYVNKIDSLDKITTNGGVKVYTAPENTEYSHEYWAPELHKINGEWYIYVAADNGDNYNHRMYVLKCLGEKPTEEFQMVGKITDSTDKWAIDGTVLQYKGELYFIWSGWQGDANIAQNIYMAHMSDPTTIDSERVLLSKPEYDWERRGGSPKINEGPVAVVKGDTVHVIYSGSGSWCDDYCLGKLTFKGEGDIMDPANWIKTEEAVFSKTDKTFGPGHCSFVETQDGTTWIVYHANLTSGTGWGGRSVWIQPVTWDGDDLVLGTPVSSEDELTYHDMKYTGTVQEQ